MAGASHLVLPVAVLALGVSLASEASAQTTVNPVQTSTYTLNNNPITFGPNTDINTTTAAPNNGSGGDAVYGPAPTNFTITNQGTLTGQNNGVNLQSQSTVTNTGTITGTSRTGVYLFQGGTVTNQAGGMISGYNGVQATSASGTVTNAGTIKGTGTYSAGVYLNAGGTVTNQAGGTISGGSYGVKISNVPGTVTNAGTITGTGNNGVYLGQGGTVTNQVTTANGHTYIGVISGGHAGVRVLNAAGTVTNAGMITGTGANGNGVYLGQGGTVMNQVTTVNGHTYIGTISGDRDGIRVIGAPGTVTNAGSIVGTKAAGVYLQQGGSVTNQATGKISGYSGVFVRGAPGTVTNAGTIAGTGRYGAGVVLSASGTLTNQAGGVISGGTYGVQVASAPGTVTNAGTITGGTNSVLFTGTGVNVLTLQTGSVLNGTATGSTAAGATNALILQGTGTANNNFINFNTLDAQVTPGSVWTLGGTSIIGTTTVTSGTLAVTGALTSAFTINSGATLQGTAASLIAQGAIIDNGTLVFDQANTGTFGNAINGSGSLVKQNSGTLVLSGTNAFTGATTIDGGTLAVTGSITATNALTVNGGGTLGGTGTVTTTNGVTINSGGAVQGGALGGIGTLNINGNLTFNPGGFLATTISPSGTANLVNVAGTATLTGGAVHVTTPSLITHTQTFEILSANSISGTFSSAAIVGTALARNPRLSENGAQTEVFLTVDSGSFAAVLPASATTNQVKVAKAIDNGLFSGGGAVPAGFQALGNVPIANLPGALSQLSGETATSSQQTTFGAMTQFMGLLLDPFAGGRGEGGAVSGGTTAFADANASANEVFTKAQPASFEQRWSTWASGFGGSQTTDGNAATGSNSATSRIAGTAVGADYLFSPRTVAGFALAGGGTNFSVANGGTGHSDLFQAGAFVKHTIGPAYISGALAYGWQDITTDRTVTVAGIDRLHAEFNANTISGRVEGGYRFVSPWIGGVGITPYAAAQFTTFNLPAYAESSISGGNNFALAHNSQSVTDSRSELGVRTDKSYAMPNGVLTLRGRLGWAHDFNPDRNVAATFQSLPGSSFVVGGAAQASDSALTTASIEMKWLNGWSAAATFEGEFSNVTQSYAGKATVRYNW